MKRVLIVGSGGREHALGWKLGQSEEVSEIFYSPGNAGTQEGKGRNISLDGNEPRNFPAIYNFVKEKNIDIVVVGSEETLADGIVDYLHKEDYNEVFGPTQKASFLESDKFFSYDLMSELGIPQADSIKCTKIEQAIQAINERTTVQGIVIKARGLTKGKGVKVCDSKEEALEYITYHARKYGPEVLIAERLFGQEFSIFGISDGSKVSPLEISIQDHKKSHDKDLGDNTGGMGAYCPAPIASASIIRNISENIMNPIVQRMKEKDIEYKGFLYAGMIMTQQGPKNKVIEFNVRFGDPECQPAMMMINNGLYESISLALEGRLKNNLINFNPGASCCVVLASQGYPKEYETELEITGIEKANDIEGVKVFHSGTKLQDGKIVTSGGRVLGVTAYSPNGIRDAQRLAYQAVSKINIPGGFHYRKDIADKALLI